MEKSSTNFTTKPSWHHRSHWWRSYPTKSHLELRKVNGATFFAIMIMQKISGYAIWTTVGTTVCRWLSNNWHYRYRYQNQTGVMAEDLKVYEAIIIPALAYVSECWAMKVNNKRKIATTEVRMLRGILGVLRRDHMRNNEIRRILHLSRSTMLYSGRLRWFGHVQRTPGRYPQSDGPGNTRYQTTRTPN